MLAAFGASFLPFFVVGQHNQQYIHQTLEATELVRFAVHDALHFPLLLDLTAVIACIALVVILRPQPHQKRI
jgi:hypothetical protein